MNGRIENGLVVVEMSRDDAEAAVREFDTLPGTRNRQKSLKGTDVYPTRVPTLNRIVKWLESTAKFGRF